jgi:uncharacterized repeat protein (TIGR02059 family)
MTKVFIVFFLAITLSLSGNTYYVSTSGKDSNPGTISQPFATWDYALNKVVAGDIVYIRDGVYYPDSKPYQRSFYGLRVYGRNGTSANPIKIFAYPGETPILDCSKITESGIHTGILIDYCQYWHFKGLTIRNVKEYANSGSYPYTADGFALSDCSNITVEQCNVYGSGSGFTLGGSNDYIYYTNCDAYENADHYDNGGLSNGFSINVQPGGHIFYDGCRAWSNSDDGYDAFGGNGYIAFNNCWAFENGGWDGLTGNGTGFKFGKTTSSKESGIQRIATNCVAFENTVTGFDESQDDGSSVDISVYNCTSYNNGVNGFAFNYRDAGGTIILRNNISYRHKYNASLRSGIENNYNTWNNNVTVSDADFVSLDSQGAKGARESDGSLPVLDYLHLASGSDLIDAGTDVGIQYSGNDPDMGAYEVQLTSAPANPVFLSAGVENSSPSIINMNYNLTLASIIPATSSFSITVNSVNRTVNSVSITGTKVSLTLTSPVVYGDAISIAYNKPSSNAIQTAAGGEAASISSVKVNSNVNAASLVYVSSVIQNAAPSIIELTYNLSLANITPAVSAFNVKVNSLSRAVSTVSISGTKVLLTLSSAAANGDFVTLAYNKPSTNPIQTVSGGQATTLSTQTVTNNIAATPPVYISSAIQNAAPGILEMTYDINLNSNIIPAISSFNVLVNSQARGINSLSISGNKVLLSLLSAVKFGDNVTVSYTKPATNPLQTLSGAASVSISARQVTNNCANPSGTNDPPVLVISKNPNSNSGFVSEIDARGTYDTNNDNLTFTWTVPNSVKVSSLNDPLIKFLTPVISISQTIEFQLKVTDGKATVTKSIPINIMPYKPEYDQAKILTAAAVNSLASDYPANASDGNLATKWSAYGIDQSVHFKLSEPFKISHLVIAFLPGQTYSSYFDIYASTDNQTWVPIMTKVVSCSFSGDLQVFDFPSSASGNSYSYIRFDGHGNSSNTLNTISEFRVYGIPQQSPSKGNNEKRNIVIYPNPATDVLNISIVDPTIVPEKIKISDLYGKLVYENVLNPETKNLKLPINLNAGIYIVSFNGNNSVLFSQKLLVVN